MSPAVKPWAVALSLAAALFTQRACVAEPAPSNPVQEFRAALLQPPGPGGPEARKKDLQKRLDALASVMQRGEALTIFATYQRGKVFRTTQEQAAAAVDQEIRELLVKRFVEQNRKAMQDDDADGRAAAVAYVGAEAAHQRHILEGEPFYGNRFARPDPPGAARPTDPFAELAPLLAERTKDKDAAVRRAAVRALVDVRSDLKQAAEALGARLADKEEDASVRRATAAALGDLLGTAAKENARTLHLDWEADKVFLRFEAQTLPLAAQGLRDTDAEVRRLCLVALRVAPDSLSEFTASVGFPNSGDFVNPQQQTWLMQARELGKNLRLVAGALNEATPGVIEALKDDKPQTVVAASEVLEAAVTARGFMRRWERGLAAASVEKNEVKPPTDDPLPVLLDARPQLAMNLSASEVHVALAAVYVLESLGSEAAPAAEKLAATLTSKDADPFVRWGAARALGKMAPAEADKAVPALAKALEDKDGDVRLTAAFALGRFGPDAKSAAPALAEAVKRDDGVRLAALQALAAVGAGAAASGAAIAALDDPDATVRVAAAESLGRSVPLSDDARKALLKALTDVDADVRRAASGALLSGK